MSLPPGHLEALCRELVRRGWWVTAAERTGAGVIVGFNFLPERGAPSWLKAFEVPDHLADVRGVEVMIRTWMDGVLWDLENGTPSETVRRMVAEHGPQVVREAMGRVAA